MQLQLFVDYEEEERNKAEKEEKEKRERALQRATLLLQSKYYNTKRINSFNEGSLPPVALRTSNQLSHHAA